MASTSATAALRSASPSLRTRRASTWKRAAGATQGRVIAGRGTHALLLHRSTGRHMPKLALSSHSLASASCSAACTRWSPARCAPASAAPPTHPPAHPPTHLFQHRPQLSVHGGHQLQAVRALQRRRVRSKGKGTAAERVQPGRRSKGQQRMLAQQVAGAAGEGRGGHGSTSVGKMRRQAAPAGGQQLQLSMQTGTPSSTPDPAAPLCLMQRPHQERSIKLCPRATAVAASDRRCTAAKHAVQVIGCSCQRQRQLLPQCCCIV